MMSLEEVRKANQELAERISRETIDNPLSPYVGKFIGIAEGEVVVVADTYKEMRSRLFAITPHIRHAIWIEGGIDYIGTRRANQTQADAINAEAWKNPQSRYAGKFVGIARGRVVVVAESESEVARRMNEIEPDSRQMMWIEASRDPSKVDYV